MVKKAEPVTWLQTQVTTYGKGGMNQEPQRTVPRKGNEPVQAGLQNSYQLETSTGFLLFKIPHCCVLGVGRGVDTSNLASQIFR